MAQSVGAAFVDPAQIRRWLAERDQGQSNVYVFDVRQTGEYDSGHIDGFTIHDEVLPGLRFDASGKLAMANTGQPDSGSCQFFITANPMPEWNGKYTIFGTVVEGKDVVSAIAHGRVHGDKPVEPVKLINVVIERVGPAPAKKKRKP